MEHRMPAGRCVHALPGRLRVKVAAVKRAPAVAAQVEQLLRQDRGVAEVMANPVTGSVLICYDVQLTTPQDILARLAPYGVSTTSVSEPSLWSQLSSELGKAVGKELVKMALAEMLPLGPVEVLIALI